MSASRLRIAMLSVHSCPVGNIGAKDTGGMSIYIRELASELSKQGHLVDIYTRAHDPRDKQIVELGKNTRLIHLEAGEVEDIHKLVMYSYLLDFACNSENFRRRNHLRYDLVFSHYWLSGRVGEYLRGWWHVPHIVMFHTLGAVKNAIGIGEDEPELRLEAERDLAQNCHHIIAATEKEKSDLLRHCGASPDRIGVIPCGVNLELFRPVDKELAKKRVSFGDNRIVLFVGRIEPLKGIDKLIRAMLYLRDTERPRLLIIGGDEHSQHEIGQLQKMCQDLDIQDSVSFLGLIRHDQLPYFYNAADACVIPSYYESFGLVALESLACGTPVVATDVGNLRSVIRQGETGYVVADNAPHHLADRIALLLARPSPDAESALLIRGSVSRFGWPTIAQTIIRECRSVLDGHLAPVP